MWFFLLKLTYIHYRVRKIHWSFCTNIIIQISNMVILSSLPVSGTGTSIKICWQSQTLREVNLDPRRSLVSSLFDHLTTPTKQSQSIRFPLPFHNPSSHFTHAEDVLEGNRDGLSGRRKGGTDKWGQCDFRNLTIRGVEVGETESFVEQKKRGKRLYDVGQELFPSQEGIRELWTWRSSMRDVDVSPIIETLESNWKQMTD